MAMPWYGTLMLSMEPHGNIAATRTAMHILIIYLQTVKIVIRSHVRRNLPMCSGKEAVTLYCFSCSFLTNC